MRAIRILQLLMLGALWLTACGKKDEPPVVEAAPPNQYEAADMSFTYPHDWKVQFDQQEGAIHVVTLESAAEMTVGASVFPAGAVDLEGYVQIQQQSFREGAAGAFRELGRETITLAARPAVEIQYTLGPNAADAQRSQFVSFEGGGKVAFVFVNAPEAGFAGIEPGFLQLLESFALKAAQEGG